MRFGADACVRAGGDAVQTIAEDLANSSRSEAGRRGYFSVTGKATARRRYFRVDVQFAGFAT
jgi:hypothetical protein